MRMLLVCALLISLSAAFSQAKDLTLDEITAKMEESDKKLTGLEFEFSQEVSYTLTNEKQVNKGKVSFQKPDNIYIKQQSPLEQEIIANGKKVWIYTPKYGQVIVDSWKKWVASSMVPMSMVNFGREWKGLKAKYSISLEGRDGDKYVLLFKPPQKESYEMRFWIEGKNYIPVKITLTGENVTIKTEMTDITLNPIIDKKLFIFKAPAGVEVMNLP